jgi:hypothetical protein
MYYVQQMGSNAMDGGEERTHLIVIEVPETSLNDTLSLIGKGHMQFKCAFVSGWEPFKGYSCDYQILSSQPAD